MSRTGGVCSVEYKENMDSILWRYDRYFKSIIPEMITVLDAITAAEVEAGVPYRQLEGIFYAGRRIDEGLYGRLTELVETDLLEVLDRVDKGQIILDPATDSGFIKLEKPSIAKRRQDTLYYRCRDRNAIESFKEELNNLTG